MKTRQPTRPIRRALRKVGAALLLLLSSVVIAQEYTVNLKDTDIQEFIKFVADVTGTTMVVDPNVKGKVRVISSKPVSQAELYDLFLSILDVQGYTAVRSGQVIRIVPSKDARSSPVPIMEDQSAVGNDEYVTQVIRLDNISAAKLIPCFVRWSLSRRTWRPMHRATPSLSPIFDPTSVASSTLLNAWTAPAMQTTEIIRLKYGVAEDVVSMLNTLEKSRQGEGADADKEAVLVADKRTNSVVVTADELTVDRIRKLVAYLDTPLEQSGNVRVIYLEYADAIATAEVLTRVMQNISRLEEGGSNKRAGSGESTIEADEGTNSLIITADTDEMAALEAVIARLDIRRAQVLIEAIIVEMTISEGQDLGLQWLFANDNGVYGGNITTDQAQQQRNNASWVTRWFPMTAQRTLARGLVAALTLNNTRSNARLGCGG